MLTTSRHLLFAASLIACCAQPLTAHSATTAAAVPIADFFKLAEFTSVRLSPDGQQLALLAAGPNGRIVLATMPVNNPMPKILLSFGDADISNLHWVSNNRLIYSLSNNQAKPGEERSGPGLFAINLDGSEERTLIRRSSSNERSLQKVLAPNHQFFERADSEHPDDIYVLRINQQGRGKRSTQDLLRLNTKTGDVATENRPADVIRWVLDQHRKPGVVSSYHEGVTTNYLKKADGSWQKLFEERTVAGDGIQAEFFDAQGKLYVSALQNGNIRALYRYDLANNKIADQPLISLNAYDYNGTTLFDNKTGEWLGLHYETDAPSTFWFRPELKKMQETVDKLLPGKANQIRLNSATANVALVYSFADNDPGSFYLYDLAQAKLTALGQTRPWIKPEQMAYKDFVSIEARDGTKLPAYITYPNQGKTNLPMVVLVHGGPNVRGEHWRWDADSQFLASRGYAVLQVDFRGSKGYGLEHERKGWKQWGLSMQDDITDATKWAIQKGIAHPKRICIAGASYGGYATLWGLIKEPDLYRCGISWVGVTDPEYLYSISWSDGNNDTEKYFLPLKVGNRETDSAQFQATSPVVHAAKLKQPLILAYGANDVRVPIAHGTRFLDAIKPHNKKVDWIVYADEGHGWRYLQNNVDFWGRVEKFLAEHTKPD